MRVSGATHLSPVEEFREGNVSLVTESVESLEVVVGAVLELDPQEGTILGGRSTTEFEGKGRSEVGCKLVTTRVLASDDSILTDTGKFGVVLHNLQHMEKRDERLVAGFDQKELEGVTVECDALEGVKDQVKDSATSHCGNRVSIRNALFQQRCYSRLPIPPISLLPKTAFSWKSAKPRACSIKVGGRRCA